MKILILAALEKEVSILNKLLKVENRTNFSYRKMNNNEIYTAVVGVGIINALSNTYFLVESIKPDIVINIGTAGAHSIDINDGDIIVCDEAIYHGGYIMNDSPINSWPTIKDTNLVIKGDKELAKLLDQIKVDSVIHHGKTLSGDFFTKDINVINALRDKYHHLCEDMETIAIYKVCTQKKIPSIAYRIISNNELKGTQYMDNVLKVNRKLQKVIFTLLNYLDSH